METFEKALETLKSGAIKPNSDEMDAAVLTQAQKEYAEEHPGSTPPAQPTVPLAIEPAKEPEKKLDDKPVVAPVVPDPENKPPDPEVKPADPEKKPEEGEPKVLTDDEILEAKEDTLSETDRLKKVEILQVRQDEEDKEISLYAEAEGISKEEAKSAIEAEIKLAEQYENDPRKLSRTARYWQSQHAKLESKIKQTSEANARSLKDNEIVIKGKKTTFDEAKPLMVEAYRNEFADAVAEKSDDEIFEIAKSDYKTKVKAHYASQAQQITDSAKSKRARMILELPDHAKPFRADIEEALNLLPDAKIVQEDYAPDDIIAWTRGKYYSPEKVKEIEDAAHKRGLENAKILGEKVVVKAGSTDKPAAPSIPPADKEVETLDQIQKDQALNMFDGIKIWDDSRKFKEYIQVMKDTGRWTPKKEIAK